MNMTSWTYEDQKLFEELMKRKTEFKRNLEASVEQVVKKFYYREMYISDVVQGLCDNAEEIVKVLSSYSTPRDSKSDEDGWIQWSGGDCPVSPDTPVHIRLRDGEEDVSRNKAEDWCWSHSGATWDIIAYRVVK